MKKKTEAKLPKELTLYKKYTEGAKEAKVKCFATKEAAWQYSRRMRAWPNIYVVPARDEKSGKFNGQWALVCCK